MASVFDLNWMELINKYTDENMNILVTNDKSYVGSKYLNTVSRRALKHMISEYREFVGEEAYRSTLDTIYENYNITNINARKEILSDEKLVDIVGNMISSTVNVLNQKRIRGYKEGSNHFKNLGEAGTRIWNEVLSGELLTEDQRDQIHDLLLELQALGSTEYGDKFDYEAAFEYALTLVKNTEMTLDQKIKDLDDYVTALRLLRESEEKENNQDAGLTNDEILAMFGAVEI